jgi:NADH-quinone oxidoreductase subunit J
MILDFILFFILAAIAVASALGMLFSRNAIYAALYLIVNFMTIAVFYIILGAPFIAISQITVYAGAIMVLFLFVLMLLGTEKLPNSAFMPWLRPAAFTLGALLLAGLMFDILVRVNAPPAKMMTNGLEFGDPKAVGGLLFTEYLLPFEVTSILLLVAMVGAIVLTKAEKH